MYGSLGDILAEKGRQLYVVSPTTTVRDAVKEMIDKGVGALAVTNGGLVVGIVSERDVLRRVVDTGRAPAATTVAAIMTADVRFGTPETSVALELTQMSVITPRKCMKVLR